MPNIETLPCISALLRHACIARTSSVYHLPRRTTSFDFQRKITIRKIRTLFAARVDAACGGHARIESNMLYFLISIYVPFFTDWVLKNSKFKAGGLFEFYCMGAGERATTVFFLR
jgi:hypothetical protein